MLSLALSESEQLNLSNRLYIRGNALLAKCQVVLAENHYQKILALQAEGVPVDSNILADVLHNLGMVAEERQDVELAISYYSRALQMNENHCMTWLFLAKLYLDRFVTEECQSDYYSGINALSHAEVMIHNFPVVRFLKQKYAIA